MKQLYILLGLVLFALACTSFYYTNIQSESNKVIVTADDPTKGSIYIYREYGEISFKNKSDTTDTSVGDTKMLVANYTSVKTGDGRGYVVFPDNSSIALSSSTEIEIQYEPTKISIMQRLGSTYHRVTTLTAENKYEVRTPNTLATVRGTKLAVTYNPITKKTYIAVTEHRVEVTKTKEDRTINGAPVMIQEGSLAQIQSATSTPKNASNTREISSTVTIFKNEEIPEIKELINENSSLDQEYDKVPFNARKEFLEKIIHLLSSEKHDVSDISNNLSSSTQNNLSKKETRPEIVTRVLKQSTRKEVTSLSTTSVPPSSPSPKLVPTIKTVTDSSAPEIQPTTGGGVSSETAVTARTQLKPYTISEDPTLAEQSFSDTFYNTYERLYLVDDPVSYCTRLGLTSAKSMLSLLTDTTKKAGYLLPKEAELLSFGTDLVSACADGSISSKVQTFKTQFDTTYPY